MFLKILQKGNQQLIFSILCAKLRKRYLKQPYCEFILILSKEICPCDILFNHKKRLPHCLAIVVLLNCKVTALQCKVTINVESFWNRLYLHAFIMYSYKYIVMYIYYWLFKEKQINQKVHKSMAFLLFTTLYKQCTVFLWCFAILYFLMP